MPKRARRKAPTKSALFPSKGLSVPVLVFKQRPSGSWVSSEKDDRLSVLRFPINLDDVARHSKSWAIEYRPRRMKYRKMEFPAAQPRRMPFSTALRIRSEPTPRKVFNNKKQLIKSVEKSVKLSAYSDIAGKLRETYGR